MSENKQPSRRGILRCGLGAASALMLAGCEPLSEQDWVKSILDVAETINYRGQRLILGRNELAAEFSEVDISPHFKPNGTSNPPDADYQALARNNFTDYRLVIDGLVEHPARLSLPELRELPSRTQITRHDCVEGWSCIGKWKGARLGPLLDKVGIKPQAKYLVFHCADTMEDQGNGKGPKYYESIDFVDARHPQTILAYDMNDRALPVPYGAPIRLRVERQLGYKMAKYVMRIEAVESFAKFGEGNGSYWADRGYEWYAGI